MWICSKCENQNSDNQSQCTICGAIKPTMVAANNSLQRKAKWHKKTWFYVGLTVMVIGIVIYVSNSRQAFFNSSTSSLDGKVIPTELPVITAIDNFSFTKKWGTLGDGEGQFKHPHSVTIDSGGYIYIADLSNNRIQKFDNNGNFVKQWGRLGNAIGELDYPSCLAYDGDSFLYVVEQNNNRVQIFDLDGNYFNSWEIPRNSSGIAIDKENDLIYIADSDNNRILKYDSNGEYLGEFGKNEVILNTPRGLALDYQGNLYVADCVNNRIIKFSKRENFLLTWGEKGSGESQFLLVPYLTIDRHGVVYVVDWGNRRVQIFNTNGLYLGQYGSSGDKDGQFNNPNGIGVDVDGNIYVADTDNHRIQKFG